MRLFALALALVAGPNVGIDFENVPLGNQVWVSLGSKLDISEPATGVVVTIEAGSELRVFDLPKFSGSNDVPGQALLDWVSNNSKGTRLVFDRPLISVSLHAGDWSSDDDDHLVLVAYDCEGKLVGKHAERWDVTRNPPFVRLIVTGKREGPGICSAHYSSGGPHPGSTFIDNIVVEPK